MPNISVGLDLIWQVASIEAMAGCHEFIEPEHLLIGVCKLGNLVVEGHLYTAKLPEYLVQFLHREATYVAVLFDQFHPDCVALYREMRQRKGKGNFEYREGAKISRSDASKAIFARAAELAAGASIITALHLLAALLDDAKGIHATLLRDKRIDVDALKEAALSVQLPTITEGLPDVTRAIKSTLLQFGNDLTQKAREGNIRAAIGSRAKTAMLQIVRTLSRVTKNNPLLIGEPGVGKTAIVEGLAWRIAEGRVPEAVRGKRIIQINLADLVAGTKYRGEFEEQVQRLIREVAAQPDVILFIDEIHTIIGAGKGEGAMDAANILKPALARGELRCIGATTIAEYRKHIEKDAALERRFQPITIEEPTRKETLEILTGIQPYLAEKHSVVIAEDAVQAAVNLSAKYLPDRRLPDKAIDVLDEACARTQIVSISASPDVSSPNGGIVTAETVAEVIAEMTGIPVVRLTEDERARLLGMADALKQRVIGQEEAVEAVAQAIQRARAGLRPAGRPIGVLLFLGPTGVGKTELARATAEFLFGSERAMTQLDMSEFMEKHTGARLIGSPPGYVGSEEEGQLTGALRRRPFSIVLLDEIEKAHPDVLNLFLQVFEDGRLTDARGRTVDATNALFIMTSNIGFNGQNGSRAYAARPIGFSPNDSDDDLQALVAEVKATLRPEFLNRIDSTIIFRPLQPEHMASIARLMLRDLEERLSEQGIGLEFNDAVVELLARLGYDEQYGARPLRRVIEQRIENLFGGMLVRKEVWEGHIIGLDVQENEMKINLIGRATE